MSSQDHDLSPCTFSSSKYLQLSESYNTRDFELQPIACTTGRRESDLEPTEGFLLSVMRLHAVWPLQTLAGDTGVLLDGHGLTVVASKVHEPGGGTQLDQRLQRTQKESGAETIALIKDKRQRQSGLCSDPSAKRAVKNSLRERCVMHICDTSPLMDVDIPVGNPNLRLPAEKQQAFSDLNSHSDVHGEVNELLSVF
ncbi:hypothetical protein llap_9824 [Limosa lapponica baueri]|uniref:Uncharacterized protein n=1 Tax=Limosa lapponica baueri TaxID=1758121 RepID=A0A2I0U1F3_LIMLA|nr:hypothetical protein llap_9824 [Limosa lapponica baueri]